MGDILTGSGLTAHDEDLYSRDAHRRRSLELYSSSPHHDREREAPSSSGSMINSKFPLELETFVFSRKPEKPSEEEAMKEDQVEQERQEHMISVSGNYISPPPGTLSFARRTGKFYPSSSASADMGPPPAATVKRRANSEQVPQLRVPP